MNVAGDRVVEAANGGADLVRSAVSHTLGANVENLVLTGAAETSGAGNELANALTGNGSANLLDGGGGADVLSGGGGGDQLNGGAGFDTADYASSSVGVTART